MPKIDKKTGIITGAGRGIGVEVARYFAENGYRGLTLVARIPNLSRRWK